MNYRRDNDKKKRLLSYALIFCLAFVIFYGRPFVDGLFSGLPAMAEPLLKNGVALEDGTSRGFFALIKFKSSLVKENELLKQKLSEAEAKLFDLDRLASENAELKGMLGRDSKEKLVLAGIIARPNQSPYDTIVLDAGSENGVKSGDLVLAYGTVVIGEVSDAYPKTSRAVMFSSAGREYQAVIQDKNIPIKLTGRGGGNFLAELPRGVDVGRGAEAVSIGLNPHLLGVVDSVFSDPRDPFQSVLLKNSVNVFSLRWVEIVI